MSEVNLYHSQEAQLLKSHDSALHSLPLLFCPFLNKCVSTQSSCELPSEGKRQRQSFFSIFSKGEKKEENWCRMMETQENCGLALIEAVLKHITACPCIFLPFLHRKKYITCWKNQSRCISL